MDIQFFQRMFEKHTAIIVLIDPIDGQIMASNQAASRFYGYSMAHLNTLNMKDINILPPTELARIRQAIIGEEHNYFIVPHRLASGERRMVEIQASLIVWEDNQFIFAIIHDITEHLQREQALRDAGDKLKTLTRAMEQSSSSIMITNVNKQIEFVNQGFTRITGYTSEEVMGQNPRLLRSGHHPPEFYQEIWATIAHEGTWQGEILNRKKNGELFWGLSRISAIKNAAAQVTHHIVVDDNITPRKQLEIQLQAANEQLMQAYDETLEGWARALDLRDKETKDHSHRVMEMTVKFAQRYGLPESDLIHIRRGALLHDIGKMGVPDNILRKQGPLDEAERLIMRLHPLYAYEMLQPVSYLQPAIDIPYCHHEKWDGTGYPRGLMGEEIPLAARLFALVDVWDALSFNRPYRLAWPKEKIQAYILDQAGFHFDPQLVPLFLELWADNSFIY